MPRSETFVSAKSTPCYHNGMSPPEANLISSQRHERSRARPHFPWSSCSSRQPLENCLDSDLYRRSSVFSGVKAFLYFFTFFKASLEYKPLPPRILLFWVNFECSKCGLYSVKYGSCDCVLGSGLGEQGEASVLLSTIMNTAHMNTVHQ